MNQSDGVWLDVQVFQINMPSSDFTSAGTDIRNTQLYQRHSLKKNRVRGKIFSSSPADGSCIGNFVLGHQLWTSQFIL